MLSTNQRNNQLIVSLLVSLLLFIPKVNAFSRGANGAGSYSRIPVGTRAAAMGNAFVAVSDDTSAFYHNPAGLTDLKWAYLSPHFQYIQGDTYLGNLTFTHPTSEESKWAFGVAANYLTTPGIKQYDSLGNAIGTANNRLLAGYFTVAKLFGDSEAFRLGLNVKLLNQKLDSTSSLGGGLDLGSKLSVSFFDLGIMLQDVITAEKYNNRNDLIYYDRILKIGVATNLSDVWRVSFQVDKNLSTTNKAVFRVGGYFKIWQAKGDVEYALDKLDSFEEMNKKSKMSNAAFSKLLNGDKNFEEELFINIGYGDGAIGFGLTLKMFGVGMDFTASFSELYLNKTDFLFTLNIPLY